MTTLDDIVNFITPQRVLVAAPYAYGQELLFLHLKGCPRGTDWVLPTVADCKRMGLVPVQHDGYVLARVDDDFEFDRPPQYDRVNWQCCDLLLTCPIDSDSNTAIAKFNRAARIDKFIAYAESLN